MRKLALILAVCAGPAWGQGVTGSSFLEVCEDYPAAGEPQNSYCTGYVTGGISGLFMGTASGLHNADTTGERYILYDDIVGAMGICLPDQYQFSQLVRILVKYLSGNPETLHQDAGVAFSTALREAFPCN